jgi:SNF2 family DNA or RNA helicase
MGTDAKRAPRYWCTSKDLNLRNQLYPFQLKGVKYGIKQRGRILIGDEMGVGKTIQALALAAVYRHNWPCVIMCPASLKFNWKDEALMWLKGLVTPSEVVIMKTSSSPIYLTTKILIVSYDLAKSPAVTLKIQNHKKTFGVAIADEAHMLKSVDSLRSQRCVPLLSSCKRVFVLSGTPAISVPYEIFNLLRIVRPDIFKSEKGFGNRYGDPKPSNWGKMMEYKGSSNEKELHEILKKHMIRRLKSDVLKDLPDKIRTKIKEIEDIKKQMENNGIDVDRQIDKMIGGAGGGANFSNYNSGGGGNGNDEKTKGLFG